MTYRDEFVPTGIYCQPLDREDCVFFDGYDWVSGKSIHCFNYETVLKVDKKAWRALRCQRCLDENPDPAKTSGGTR